MVIGLLSLFFELTSCSSLKEKRHIIKPLITRLHREFNISVAEVDKQDHWQNSVICCSLVSNDSGYAHMALQEVVRFVEKSFPDLKLLEFHIEIIH